MVFGDKFIRINVIGIIINLILVIVKISIGLLTNSSAILVDGLKNINAVVATISDVIESKIKGIHNPQSYSQVGNLSSIVVSIAPLIGTKIAQKPPNQYHPHGYGRVEYITSMVVSLIVVYVTSIALSDSIINIIYPAKVVYTNLFLIIIFFSVIVKIGLGFYLRNRGKNLNISELIESSKGEFTDSLVSFSTLIVALISINYNISLEGYLGCIIAMFVLKSCYEILKDNINRLVGPPIDEKYINKIEKSILEVPGVKGVYDLKLHEYGPKRTEGSAYIKIDPVLTAKEINDLSSVIISKIYDEFSIIMVVGIVVGYDYYYMQVYDRLEA